MYVKLEMGLLSKANKNKNMTASPSDGKSENSTSSGH